MALRTIKLCKQEGCSNAATTEGYCRFHYLKNWKEIKDHQKKKAVKSLNNYIDHVMKEHPAEYMDVIREDLRNADQFHRKADNFSFRDDEIRDVMEDVSGDDISRLIGSIKIDDAYWGRG